MMKTDAPHDWHCIKVIFADADLCKALAFELAVELGCHYEKVYFARYTNALHAYASFYLSQPRPKSKSVKLSHQYLVLLLKQRPAKLQGKVTVEPAVPSPGSDAHAAGFAFVAQFTIAQRIGPNDEPIPEAERLSLFNDVIHWTHNMAGFDYIDEMRGYLEGIAKITSVFERSILEGKKLTKTSKTPNPLSKN